MPALDRIQAARRDAILREARKTFLAEGYAGASMSMIATRLGGSKATLYRYFDSKAALFAAVMDESRKAFVAALDAVSRTDGPLDRRLQRVGETYLNVIASDDALALTRLVFGEAGRIPELGALFYTPSSLSVDAWLTQMLCTEMERGALPASPPERAAQQFLALCRLDLHHRLVVGVRDRPTSAEISARVAIAVTAMLKILKA